MNKKIPFLLLGIFACSTAALMIRCTNMHPILLASYRLLLASLCLSPLFFKKLKDHKGDYLWRHLRASILPGLLMGAHFILWIMAVKMTTIVNATLIVNLVPVAMPFFMFALIRERITSYELIGTLLALVGLYLLASGDFSLNHQHFQGDLLCLLAMVLLTAYLALGRKNRNIVSIWLYIVPLYFIGGLFCFVVALFFTNPIQAYSSIDIAVVVGLVLVPTIIGHSILNHCMKYLRGQIVSILNLSQFIFAGTMGYLFLDEAPTRSFYIASVIIVVGAVIAIRGKPQRTTTPKVE